MTVLTETPRQQATTLSMKHAYNEAPGVKKLARGYKLLPKVSLSDEFRGLLLKSIFITFMSTLVVYAAVCGARIYIPVLTPWTAGIVFLFAPSCFTVFMRPFLSWAFNAPDSPIVINKEHRANLKKTRRLAAQLGESVVPVLTEAHIAAIEKIHIELTTTAQAPGEELRITRDNNYDRIAVLLLEDLNREPLLFDLIKNRGLSTMDEIEAMLRSIEDNATTPLQSGWL